MKKRTHNEHGPSHVTPAGHSVFYDLGFDEAEARVLEMRADLTFNSSRPRSNVLLAKT